MNGKSFKHILILPLLLALQTNTYSQTAGQTNLNPTAPSDADRAVIAPLLNLPEGWSLISWNRIPEDNNIATIFRPVVERGSLDIVRNSMGSFYMPELGYNGIVGGWDWRQAYLIKMNRADALRIEGELVDPETPIELVEGQNYVAYFPQVESDPIEAFSSIADYLIAAYDHLGGSYIPAEDYLSMAPLRPGRGYEVWVSEPCELIWNAP